MQGYEDHVLSEYVHKTTSKLVFARADNENIRKLLGSSEEILAAPFGEIDNWIRQKILEMKAYLNSVEGLENMINERTKLIEKKISSESKLVKLKEKPGKEREVSITENELMSLYKEVENQTAIINIAISYMSDIFLPTFKRRQLMLFYRILERLFNSENESIHKLAQAWSSMLIDKNLKHF